MGVENYGKNFFMALKKLLTSSDLLIHFNHHLKIILACDISSNTVGAVLAHCMPMVQKDLLDMPVIPCPRLKRTTPT